MNKYLLIITLNVNRLNVPIKRHRLAEQIRKHNPGRIYAVYKRLPQNKRSTQAESEGMEKILQANGH